MCLGGNSSQKLLKTHEYLWITLVKRGVGFISHKIKNIKGGKKTKTAKKNYYDLEITGFFVEILKQATGIKHGE